MQQDAVAGTGSQVKADLSALMMSVNPRTRPPRGRHPNRSLIRHTKDASNGSSYNQAG